MSRQNRRNPLKSDFSLQASTYQQQCLYSLHTNSICILCLYAETFKAFISIFTALLFISKKFIEKSSLFVANYDIIWYNECKSIHYTLFQCPCRYANQRFAPCNRAIIPYSLRLYGIMNANLSSIIAMLRLLPDQSSESANPL